jgi:hypothetical protein
MRMGAQRYEIVLYGVPGLDACGNRSLSMLGFHFQCRIVVRSCLPQTIDAPHSPKAGSFEKKTTGHIDAQMYNDELTRLDDLLSTLI